jgi:hypothetical protein
MNKITLTIAFVAALCSASPIEADKELVARTSINFVMSNYNAYPCDSASVRELGSRSSMKINLQFLLTFTKSQSLRASVTLLVSQAGELKCEHPFSSSSSGR